MARTKTNTAQRDAHRTRSNEQLTKSKQQTNIKRCFG